METIADIVRLLRSSAHIQNADSSQAVLRFADRIEAAYKREMAVSKTEPTTKENLAVGNGAKTRDALKYLRDASREFCHLILNSKYNEVFDKYKHAEVSKIRDAIANAGLVLATPPRNCDVGTAEEQHKRYVDFCCRQDCCGRCPLENAIDAPFGSDSKAICTLAWVWMPYEEGDVE